MDREVNNRQKGFTLVELLVVMVILGLLAAMVLPNFFGQAVKARVKATRIQIVSLGTALDTFALDVGRYPSTDEGLESLRTAPSGVRMWDGPYLPKNVPDDPWGNPYNYSSPVDGAPYEIVSYGADGKTGGDADSGDISSKD